MLETEKYVIKMECGSVVFKAKEKTSVTISVPHDGFQYQAFAGFFEARKVGYFGRDLNVWPITKDILLKISVNAIRGLMPRGLLDYNRAWPKGINYYPLTQKEVHTAFDDVRLQSAYEHYHKSIDQMVESAISTFAKSKTLLIDLHGFAKQPPYAPEGGYDLILGTGNRITIPYGDIDVRFAEYMTKMGYKVFLPKDQKLGPIEDYYSADFTTRHHSKKHGINVLQIEIASRFRAKGSLELGQKLSFDFAQFLELNYLNY